MNFRSNPKLPASSNVELKEMGARNDACGGQQLR
jgi:hypothetical protein